MIVDISFIKDFSKIARPLSNLLTKDVPCHLNWDCLKDFELLKGKLVIAPIVIALKLNQDLS